MRTSPQENVKPTYLVRTDRDLLSFGYVVLDRLESIATSMVPDPQDVDRRLRQVCAYFHAAKIHGSTLAAMALLERGYAREAFPYQRFIYEYFLSAHYYERFSEEAVRFVASMPLLFQRQLDKWMSFDPALAGGIAAPGLDAAVAQAKQRFPTLMRPKGKSGASKNPVMKDWAPPEPCDMSIKLFTADLKNDPAAVEIARAKYQMPSSASIEVIAERFARERHFIASENPSQFIHGTVFSLLPMLSPNGPKLFAKFSMEFDEENAMLCGALDLCHGVAGLLGRVNGVDVTETLAPIKKEFEAFRRRFVGDS